jgi:hypothetical protein
MSQSPSYETPGLLPATAAGFAGTYGATAFVGRHLFSRLCGLPIGLAARDYRAVGSRPLASHRLIDQKQTGPKPQRRFLVKSNRTGRTELL